MHRPISPVDQHFAPEDWRGLVVICSGTSWDGPRLSDRHLAERMTNYAPVLFVDPPISLLSPLRRAELRRSVQEPRLRRIDDRLARLTPIAPPGVSRPILRDVAMTVTRRALARAVQRLGGDVEAVIVGSLDDYFGACEERQKVLWGTDDFASAGELMGVSRRWLDLREADQLAKADIVTAVSEILASKWTAAGAKAVTVIPNGCDATRFRSSNDAPPPVDVELPAPIALFMGHLSDRIDLSCLESVAETGLSLLLVGHRQSTFNLDRMESLLRRPNVQWVGPKGFLELRSYLRVASVGLTPYLDSSFNRSSFPLKTLEYLAAGLPVVSSDLPSARALGTDLVSVVKTADEFGRKALELAMRGDRDGNLARAQDFAARHDWDLRVAELAQLLGLTRADDHAARSS